MADTNRLDNDALVMARPLAEAIQNFANERNQPASRLVFERQSQRRANRANQLAAWERFLQYQPETRRL